MIRPACLRRPASPRGRAMNREPGVPSASHGAHQGSKGVVTRVTTLPAGRYDFRNGGPHDDLEKARPTSSRQDCQGRQEVVTRVTTLVAGRHDTCAPSTHGLPERARRDAVLRVSVEVMTRVTTLARRKVPLDGSDPLARSTACIRNRAGDRLRAAIRSKPVLVLGQAPWGRRRPGGDTCHHPRHLQPRKTLRKQRLGRKVRPKSRRPCPQGRVFWILGSGFPGRWWCSHRDR